MRSVTRILRIRIAEIPILTLRETQIEIDITSLREVTLGRAPTNVVIIPDPTVSRRHASIIKTERGLRLRDLGSKNGTYLKYDNDFIKISEIDLPPRCIVKLGHYTVLELELKTAELC